MIQRMALLIALSGFGLLFQTAHAQSFRAAGDPNPGSGVGSFRRPDTDPTRIAADVGATDATPRFSSSAEGLPSGFPTEGGLVFRTYDISGYTALPHNDSAPQNALVEWIFRRSGSSVWHGDTIAVLSVNQAQLRAYHDPEIIAQVEEMVQRFIDAQPSDFLKLRVRAVAAADTRWRYAVATRLKPVATGEQGQQVWSLDVEDAAMVRTQMQVYQGFKLLLDQEVTMINGQTLTVVKEMDVEYVSGPQRDSAVGMGYQPAMSRIKEGVTMRVSPLLTYEGDAIDLALDLKVDIVSRLLPTKILTQREIGPAEMTIDVPEASELRINQTITGWKMGETLVISAGIHPGVLQSKNGFMNLRIPGTVPTRTELLIFLDAEAVGAPAPRVARDGDTSP